MDKIERLSKKQMIDAYWLHVLRGPEDRRWLDDIMIQFIEEGLVEYDPQADMLEWIGPTDAQGRAIDPRDN